MNKLISVVCALSFLSFSSYGNEKLTQCDTKQCKQYYKQYSAAAKRGHAQAILILGQFYQHGYGTKVDLKKALFNYKKAARAGNTAANYKVGLLYLNNEENRDIKKGIDYLKKAAAKDFKNANFLLSLIYVNKDFGPHDLKQADQYLAKTYRDRHPDIPQLISYIEATTEIDSNTLPKLAKEVSLMPLVKNEQADYQWPHHNTEVITITASPLETILNQTLVTVRGSKKALGSRLPSSDCSNKFGCHTTGFEGFLNDFPFIRFNG